MFIDIHVHTRKVAGFPRWGKQAYAKPEQLLEKYDRLGIEKGVLLPGVSPECSFVPQSMEEILEISREHADRFIPFCNIDPRMLNNSPNAPLGEIIAYYKKQGCKGVGEITANLPFNDPLVKNLFHHCQQQQMPLTFHIGHSIGGCYGLYDEPGFPMLEQTLQEFPDLIFLGHSQAFWMEIGPLEEGQSRKGYPKGKIEKPGQVVELMRRYENLHGDLSAGSGCNAVSRDEEFGVSFLKEFQDRLYFGTDICAPETNTPLVDFLIKLKTEGKIDETCFNKIARENAIKLLKL